MNREQNERATNILNKWEGKAVPVEAIVLLRELVNAGDWLVVTVSWPADPERGIETYGPFDTPVEQERFVSQCQTAADEGWELLRGAQYLIHRIGKPFDPTTLWERGNGAMRSES